MFYFRYHLIFAGNKYKGEGGKKVVIQSTKKNLESKEKKKARFYACLN
ncbi:hypothetical protein SAMN05216474_0368 [Lishizhenia tianjinensis]|uniref:Uncharacterized protein n=1 Tax=Lishizhenia tianjinensis TaxID=477690 RepID=A0A1I6XPI8_9FLAO|nr:hypothetical protein SAMN05216474_0368 [Lishizhenia tianjinensis]